jgi:hypothetical protein
LCPISENKIEPYVAERDPQYGIELTEKIKHNIDSADAILVLWTKNSQHSDWVNQEIGYAEKGNKRILPLVEKGVNVKGFLQGLEHVKFDTCDITEAMGDVSDYLENYKIEKEQMDALKIIGGFAIGLLALGALAKWLPKK